MLTLAALIIVSFSEIVYEFCQYKASYFGRRGSDNSIGVLYNDAIIHKGED